MKRLAGVARSAGQHAVGEQTRHRRQVQAWAQCSKRFQAAGRRAAALTGEHESLLALPDGGEDAEDLLCADGQHVEVDAVELVEAAPEAGLGEAPEDLAHVDVVELVAAVEHHHILAERVAEVLGRLGLARPGGAGGGAAEAHVEGLGERDVADVGEGRDDEALLDPEVLVGVLELGVGDGDDSRVLLGAPVEARLLEPLEVGRVADALLDQLVRDVALVDVDGDDRLEVGALVARQLARRQDDHLGQHLPHALLRLVHDVLLRLGGDQGRLHLPGPLQLHAQERHLGREAEDELVALLRLHVARRSLDDRLDRVLHPVHQALEPDLDRTRGVDGVLHRDHLLLPRLHLDDLRLVLLVERDGRDGVEEARLEVGLHLLGVRPDRQHLQQRRVRNEVEARELGTLVLQVAAQGLLAQLQLLGDVGQHALERLVRETRLDDALVLLRRRHHLRRRAGSDVRHPRPLQPAGRGQVCPSCRLHCSAAQPAVGLA